MGSTVGDWDLDGKLDVMFTSASISDTDLKDLNQVAATAGMLLSFRGNHLYKNLGGRKFLDVTDTTGLRESGWGWGAFFFDFDNDGDLDALNGNGMDDPETTDDDWAVNQKMKLYVNQGDDEMYQMKDEASARGIASEKENRAALSWDYDNDGDLDVFVVNHADIPSIYRNDGGNYYDYIRVKVYEESGRESLGAKVYLYVTAEDFTEPSHEVYYREIGSTSAFLGQGEAHAHFGLGKLSIDNVYAIRIKWPMKLDQYTGQENKEEQVFYDVPVRSTLYAVRGRSKKSYNGNSINQCVF